MAKRKRVNKVSISLWSLVLLCAVIIFSILVRQPSNTRDWEEEFAVQPTVSIKDNFVTISNIRDWRYSENEIISKNYISRTYDVTKLKKMWFMLEPFGGWDGVAHTYFVFDFEDQDPVSFSIEARREKGETYTAFQGLQRKFETVYLWGTESDFTVKRAVYLKNNVYMFPLITSDGFEKKLFMELAQQTIALNRSPRFYNTLTSNCTNSLADIANLVIKDTVPFHYSRLLTGYSAEYLHDLGYIPNEKSYDEMKNDFLVNEMVKKTYSDQNFSKQLREKLSGN